VYLRMRGVHTSRTVRGRASLAGVVLAAAGGFQLFGLLTSPPGVVGLITDLAVVLTPAVAFGLRHVRPGRRLAFAAFVAIVGSAGLGVSGHRIVVTAGDLLCLVGAVLYSVHAVLLDDAEGETEPLALTAWELATGGTAALIAELAMVGLGLTRGPRWNLPGWFLWALAFEIFVSTLGGYAVQAVSQRQSGSTRFVLLSSLDGVASLLFGALLWGERLTPFNLTGAALVTASVLLSKSAEGATTPGSAAQGAVAVGRDERPAPKARPVAPPLAEARAPQAADRTLDLSR